MRQLEGYQYLDGKCLICRHAQLRHRGDGRCEDCLHNKAIPAGARACGEPYDARDPQRLLDDITTRRLIRRRDEDVERLTEHKRLLTIYDLRPLQGELDSLERNELDRQHDVRAAGMYGLGGCLGAAWSLIGLAATGDWLWWITLTLSGGLGAAVAVKGRWLHSDGKYLAGQHQLVNRRLDELAEDMAMIDADLKTLGNWSPNPRGRRNG